MTRYRVLRDHLGLDIVAASFVVFTNWLFRVPEGLIRFSFIEIEYDVEQERVYTNVAV